MKRSIIFFASLTLCFSTFSCAKADEKTNPKSEPTDKALNIEVTLPSASVGKTAWSKDDRVNFMVIKGEDKLSETMAPASFDGAKANFEFSSFFPTDAEAYYAFVPGEGAGGFVGSNSIRVKAFSRLDPGARIPVTAGKADNTTKKMAMKAVYGQLSFVTETSGISHVIFEGNGGENVSRDNIVNLDDFSVKADPEAESPGVTSIRVEVSGAGTYYIPLYPGMNLPSGYKLTAYGTNGKVALSAKEEKAVTVEAGKIYSAPKFKEEHGGSGVFDATKVACSFAMISDTHINGSNSQNCEDKLRSAFSQLKNQAGKDDSNGLDGVVISGDLIDYGQYLDSQLPVFKSIYESAFDPEKTPLVYTIGNHDPNTSYWWNTSVYNFAKSMRSKFGTKYEITDIEKTMRDQYECRHCVICGYHILAVTPNSTKPVAYPSEVYTWLDNTLKSITEADPERYVIVITHPMIYDTVYGSLLGPEWVSGSLQDQWYTKALTPTLKKYPQVIAFGGHLHFPINDPRSIWQGDFTVLGCGSTRYMAIEDGGYENMSSATVMKDAADISSGLLLQFDESGNARITKMFFSQNTAFGYPWEIAHPAADKSHLKTYNHEARKQANKAPILSTLNVQKTGQIYKAVFAAGTDDEFVHHYILTLKKGSQVVATKRILADFYRNSMPDDMKTQWEQSFGQLDPGSYELTLIAEDSWGKQSEPLMKSFSTDGKKNWAMNAKLFDPNGALGKGNTESYTVNLTVTEHSGENGNNVLIKGLFLDAEVEGKIEYSGSKIKRVGIYLSSKRFYKADASRYCVLLPGCSAKGSYWKDYEFFPSSDKAFSDNNYDWLWFDVDASGTVARYKYYNAGQTSPNGKYTYLGLSFGWASQSAITSSAYDVIYQANYATDNDKGMWLDLPSD